MLSVGLSVVFAAFSFAPEINEGNIFFISHLLTELGAGLIVGSFLAGILEGTKPKRESE